MLTELHQFEVKGLCLVLNENWFCFKLLFLYIPMLLSVPETESIYTTGGTFSFLRCELAWPSTARLANRRVSVQFRFCSPLFKSCGLWTQSRDSVPSQLMKR